MENTHRLLIKGVKYCFVVLWLAGAVSADEHSSARQVVCTRVSRTATRDARGILLKN